MFYLKQFFKFENVSNFLYIPLYKVEGIFFLKLLLT